MSSSGFDINQTSGRRNVGVQRVRVAEVFGHATKTVGTLLSLGAIRIEHVHPEIENVRRRRRAQHQQLITPNSVITI